MTLIPEGPRPRTSLELGWFAWAVLGAIAVAFLLGRKVGWLLLTIVEAFYSAVILLTGVIDDPRSAFGLVFLLLSLGLMLAPGTRAYVGVGRAAKTVLAVALRITPCT